MMQNRTEPRAVQSALAPHLPVPDPVHTALHFVALRLQGKPLCILPSPNDKANEVEAALSRAGISTEKSARVRTTTGRF